ncbi:MAG TPA: 50S ribosomal protein L24 [Oligoflexia bacterium]|nr:50S ribosomal protein L24 [Oligoflexia bacterium]HMP49194.1 50S ribosomal protein L24 [Oligoflexia bacterium]
MKTLVESSNISREKFPFKTDLRVGDSVMVIAGGNKAKGKVLKGQVGTLKKILPKKGRVIVEGLNFIKRHKRASSTQEQSAIITKEGSIDISNVMFYSEAHKRPFRLKSKVQENGSKVRGFVNPDSKKFEAVE